MAEIRVISPTPSCPKCKSYMFMICQISDVFYRRCKNCGYKKCLDKIDFKKVVANCLERFKFWKS